MVSPNGKYFMKKYRITNYHMKLHKTPNFSVEMLTTKTASLRNN